MYDIDIIEVTEPVCPHCGGAVKRCNCNQKPRCPVHNAFLVWTGLWYKCPIPGCSYAQNKKGEPSNEWWKHKTD